MSTSWFAKDRLWLFTESANKTPRIQAFKCFIPWLGNRFLPFSCVSRKITRFYDRKCINVSRLSPFLTLASCCLSFKKYIRPCWSISRIRTKYTCSWRHYPWQRRISWWSLLRKTQTLTLDFFMSTIQKKSPHVKISSIRESSFCFDSSL